MNIEIPAIRSLFVAAALIAGVGAASTNTAQASLVLTLESGATTIVIADNGIGDMDGTVGMIAYMGAVGSFTMNMVGGAGGGVAPWPTVLDLHGMNMSSGAGTLIITLEDDGYVPLGPISRLNSDIGGTIGAGGSLSSAAYFDAAGAPASLGALWASHGPYSTPSFSSSIASGPTATPDPFGLAVQLTVTHATAALTSYDHQIRIDEPTTLGLFGLALTGFGLLARRRRTR
jgi:hypothetical protein